VGFARDEIARPWPLEPGRRLFSRRITPRLGAVEGL